MVTVASPPGPDWLSRFASGRPTRLRSADDDDVRAAGLDAGADQHLLHAIRRRRLEAGRVAEDQLADVHRVEAVDVLRGIDPAQHPLGVDLLAAAAAGRGCRESRDRRSAGRSPRAVRPRCCRPASAHDLRVHPGLDARLRLGPHVDLRRRILADQDHGEPGHDPSRAQRCDAPAPPRARIAAPMAVPSMSRARHFAMSDARVSRITVTRICPGYCSSLSIRRAIVSESVCASRVVDLFRA